MQNNQMQGLGAGVAGGIKEDFRSEIAKMMGGEGVNNSEENGEKGGDEQMKVKEENVGDEQMRVQEEEQKNRMWKEKIRMEAEESKRREEEAVAQNLKIVEAERQKVLGEIMAKIQALGGKSEAKSYTATLLNQARASEVRGSGTGAEGKIRAIRHARRELRKIDANSGGSWGEMARGKRKAGEGGDDRADMAIDQNLSSQKVA